jgi:hypothetical protein
MSCSSIVTAQNHTVKIENAAMTFDLPRHPSKESSILTLCHKTTDELDTQRKSKIQKFVQHSKSFKIKVRNTHTRAYDY